MRKPRRVESPPASIRQNCPTPRLAEAPDAPAHQTWFQHATIPAAHADQPAFMGEYVASRVCFQLALKDLMVLGRMLVGRVSDHDSSEVRAGIQTLVSGLRSISEDCSSSATGTFASATNQGRPSDQFLPHQPLQQQPYLRSRIMTQDQTKGTGNTPVQTLTDSKKTADQTGGVAGRTDQTTGGEKRADRGDTQGTRAQPTGADSKGQQATATDTRTQAPGAEKVPQSGVQPHPGAQAGGAGGGQVEPQGPTMKAAGQADEATKRGETEVRPAGGASKT